MKNTMKKLHFLLALLLAAYGIGAEAQSAQFSDSTLFTGYVYDYYNREPVEKAKVIITEKESGISCEGVTYFKDTVEVDDEMVAAPDGFYAIYTPIATRYTITVEAPGYTPKTVDMRIPVQRNKKRFETHDVQDILLMRSPEYNLSEASVTATKILMVNRGDTLVYNASYFQLSHGSMLGALVNMLPGMEIRDGGQIFLNGRQLDNLLINGKDFFKGDPAVALQNLPAYTVKEVKVYNKAEAGEYLQKHKDTKKEDPNTIDVILKKQYHNSWIANFDMAGGAVVKKGAAAEDALYLAHAFVTQFSNYRRLAIYGNANNTGNTQTVSEQGQWSGAQSLVPSVNYRRENVGMMMSLYSKDSKAKYTLHARMSRDRKEEEKAVSATTFLSSTDVFKRQRTSTRGRELWANLYNEIEFELPRIYISLLPQATYTHRSERKDALSAQFSENPDNICPSCLDSIYPMVRGERLADVLTNRLSTEDVGKTDEWKFSNTFNTTFNSPLLHNSISIKGAYNYRSLSHNRYELYDLWGDKFAPVLMNRYYLTPDKSHQANAVASYNFRNMMSDELADVLYAQLRFQYDGYYSNSQRDIYNLHELPGFSTPYVSMLPSVAGWQEATIDPRNSYRRDISTNRYILASDFMYGDYRKTGSVQFFSELYFYHNAMTDTRAPQKARQNFVKFSPSISYDRTLATSHGSCTMGVGYRLSHTPVPTSYLLDISDESNPLLTQKGNTALRNADTHQAHLTIDASRDDMKSSVRAKASYSKTKNAIAMGYNYDETTGAYTYKPENVQGNWQADATIDYTQQLGAKSGWHLYARLNANLINSADIVDGARSVVKNGEVAQNNRLTWRIKNLGSLALLTEVAWQHATSGRAGFTTRNTWRVSAGANVSINLTKDIFLTSNMLYLKRMNYDDSSMNDHQMLWNAKVGWKFTKDKKWALALEGYDLLHQVAGIHRDINVQGITETRVSTLPSYLMLHLTFDFSKFPSGKGK